MNNSDYLQIIKDIIDLDNITKLVNHTIEEKTGVKLYNKEEILKEISSLDVKDTQLVLNIITKNMLVQIKFETIFKSHFGFSLIFDNNKPIVIYCNRRVALTDLESIRKDILETKIEHLPPINNLFLDTMFTIIEKIIIMDWSVTYNCTDWPQPWLALFENKCYKHDKNMKNKLGGYKYIDDIITGLFYKKIEEEEKYDYNIKEELIENKEDSDMMHRMEVMAYLNDNEVIYFLDTLEKYDKVKYDIVNETNLIRQILEITSNTSNKIIKFYFINKLFQYIITIKDFLLTHQNFYKTVNNKLDEITDDLYIIQSTGLNLSIELTNTLIEAKEFMHKLKN